MASRRSIRTTFATAVLMAAACHDADMTADAEHCWYCVPEIDAEAPVRDEILAREKRAFVYVTAEIDRVAWSGGRLTYSTYTKSRTPDCSIEYPITELAPITTCVECEFAYVATFGAPQASDGPACDGFGLRHKQLILGHGKHGAPAKDGEMVYGLYRNIDEIWKKVGTSQISEDGWSLGMRY